MQDLCPFCGTKRIGAFRYCRACRFDFDTLGADAAARAASHLPAVSDAELLALAGIRHSPVRGLLALAFVVVVGLAGLSTGIGPDTRSRATAVLTTSMLERNEKRIAAALVAAAPIAAAPVVAPSDTPSAAAPLAGGPIGKTTTARVVRVIDGATILVAVGDQRLAVRYLGIDPPQGLGRRASAANASLVAGKTVILEGDGSGTDRSGHVLRYVWLQRGATWTLVNAELIRRGLATLAAHSPGKRYVDRLDAAEREARARHLGVWGAARAPGPPPEATRRPTKASGG